MRKKWMAAAAFLMALCLGACGDKTSSEAHVSHKVGQTVQMSQGNGSGSTDGRDESGNGGTEKETTASGQQTEAPVVYFTSTITADSLVEIYHQLGFAPEGKVAVKMSTGEPPASNYLRPELIEKLVKEVNGTIVECNTAYLWGVALNLFL